MRRPLVVVLALLVALAGACSDASSPTDALLQEGLKAHSEGKLDEAQTIYRKILEQDPRNKFAYYNLGAIAQAKGNDTQAESDFRLAINIDPRYIPALYNLAIIRTNVAAHDEAESLYRKIIEIDPEHADAHQNLGFLLRKVGRTEEGDAEIALATALRKRKQQSATPHPGG